MKGIKIFCYIFIPDAQVSNVALQEHLFPVIALSFVQTRNHYHKELSDRYLKVLLIETFFVEYLINTFSYWSDLTV